MNNLFTILGFLSFIGGIIGAITYNNFALYFLITGFIQGLSYFAISKLLSDVANIKERMNIN